MQRCLLEHVTKREMQILVKELEQLKCLPVQAEISSLSIQLLVKYHLSHGLDYHDALIAATSIYHQLDLYTLNIKDFIFIPEIKLFHP